VERGEGAATNLLSRIFQKGKIERSIRELRSLAEKNPRDVRIRIKLGELYMKKGEPDRAIEQFNIAARSYTELGFVPKAIALYKQILRINLTDWRACLRLADLYIQSGLLAEAAVHCREAAKGIRESGTREEDVALYESIEAAELPDLREKLELIRIVLDEGDTEERFRRISGMITGHQVKKEARESEFILKVLLDHYPRRIEFKELMANNLKLLGDHVAANQMAEDLEDLYNKLGILKEKKDFLKTLRRPVKADSREEATSGIERSTNQEPRVVELGAKRGYKDRVRIRMEAPLPGDGAGEESQFNGGTDRSRNLVEQGEADRETAKTAQVLAGFKEKSREQIPDEDYESHFNLGIAYKEMDLFDDAIEAFEKAISDPERRLDCIMNIGFCHMAMERASEAAGVFKQGLSLEGLSREEWLALQYELACALEAAGKRDLAAGLYRKIVDTDQDYRDAAGRLAAMDES